MSQLREINVGLMGLGVVGGGVAGALLDPSQPVAAQVGLPVNLKKVLVRDPGRHRDSPVPAEMLTTNPEDLLGDSDIHVVVEVIGGVDPAARYLTAALASGKHVVTANKEVMAKHGPELFDAAQRGRVNLLFEASVGGGIPIIGSLMRQLLANEICSIRSIINGTTNYILTRMAYEHASFDDALAEAQQRGYAEADPTNDVEGFDAVYKLSILASLAFHQRVAPEAVYREGISGLQPQDFRYAQELGYAIKSLAIATLETGGETGGIGARVYPALISLENMLGKVDGVYNAVEVTGSLCGQVLLHGMGAGRGPTTSAVVGDLIDIGRRIQANEPPADAAPGYSGRPPLPVKPVDDLQSRYYIRLNVTDQAGVLAQISRILGDRDISIASVLQKDTFPEEQTAELVITTHPAREASVREALGLVGALGVVNRVSNMLRIEE